MTDLQSYVLGGCTFLDYPKALPVGIIEDGLETRVQQGMGMLCPRGIGVNIFVAGYEREDFDAKVTVVIGMAKKDGDGLRGAEDGLHD